MVQQAVRGRGRTYERGQDLESGKGKLLAPESPEEVYSTVGLGLEERWMGPG